MRYIKYSIVWFLESLDRVFDHVPTYSDDKFCAWGGWGCRMRLADYSARLDDRWKTGLWKEPDRHRL